MLVRQSVHNFCALRKLMKAKGPAAAKVEEEKKKGLALFGPKPPTPKLLRAFGGNINKAIIDKMKVRTAARLTCHVQNHDWEASADC